MKSAMVELFWNHTELIVFAHVLSAVVWVGGMIAMRYAAHFSFQALGSPELILKHTHKALKNLFIIVAPFILILILTAVLMAVGWGYRDAAVDANHNIIDETAYAMYNLVHLKEGIWMVMAVNYLGMVFLLSKAGKLIVAQNYAEAKSKMGLIGKYMVPLNISLGILAIFLGVTLRYAH